MATPTGSSYGSPVGIDLLAGQYKWPLWRRNILPNTWGVVTTHALTDVDPAKDPLINPNTYPFSPWRGTSGQPAIFEAWGGACWDESRRELWIPIGGGHSNYAGNESYKAELGLDSPIWRLLNRPSGAIGNLITLDDGQESSGIYSDGAPRSIHSYGSIVFVPSVGALSCGNSSVYRVVGGPSRTWQLGRVNNRWISREEWLPPYSGSVNSACYDSLRHRVWARSGNVNLYLGYLDVNSWDWHLTGMYDSNASTQRMVYIPEFDAIINMSYLGFRAYTNLDNSSPTRTDISISGSPPSGWTYRSDCGTGMAWDGEKLLFWNNESNTTAIGTLTPSSGATGSWTWGQLYVDPSNAVTPSIYQYNGTYGRFDYSPSLGGCFLVNSNTGPIYFFAME